MKSLARRYFPGHEEDFWVRFALLGIFSAGLYFIILLAIKSKIKEID
jgi:hypothetical protein